MDFIRDYIKKNEGQAEPYANQLLKVVRDDHVSTEKLIELSLDPNFTQKDQVMRAMTKRLAQKSSTMQLPKEILGEAK